MSIAFYELSQLLDVCMYVCIHILHYMYIVNTYIAIIIKAKKSSYVPLDKAAVDGIAYVGVRYQ